MYYFYLDKMLLPVAPAKLQTKVNNQNKTMILLNEGQVNIIKDAGLTDISFEAVLPSARYSFASYKDEFLMPAEYLSELDRLKKEKKPFQFIVTRTRPDGTILFDTNITVTLESYKVSEEANEGFDVNVSIDLKQFREYGTKAVKIINTTTESKSKATKQKKRNSKSEQGGTTHKVVSGDCLWTIAKKYYGDGSKYKKIYTANQEMIDKRNKGTGLDKYTIYTGQVLTIPK